jgi:hypothetical protein
VIDDRLFQSLQAKTYFVSPNQRFDFKIKEKLNYKLHGLLPYIQNQNSKIMTNKSNHENVTSKFIQKSNNHV